MCDVAHVLLAEQLERQVLSDRQVAATFIAAGAKDVDLPDVAVQREALDAALAEEPRLLAVADSEQYELRRALGVA